MDVLAFDLSKSNTGWARYRVGDARPTYGSFKLGGSYTDRIGAMRKLYQEIEPMWKLGDPDLVAFEAPLRGDAQSTEQNNRNANAWAAIIEFTFGSLRRIRVQEVDNRTWKSHFFDTAIPQRVRNELNGKMVRNPAFNPKEVCMAQCRALGLKPANFDEADALGLLDYTLATEMIIPPWRQDHLLTSPITSAEVRTA